GLLRPEAGRALDPALVPVFVDLLPSLIAEVGPETPSVPQAEPEVVAVGSTAAGLVPASGNNAFENIALAHREIYALYEIAQSMGTSLGVSDTLALISSKLAKLITGPSCALLLQQTDTDSLKCRIARGVDGTETLDVPATQGHGR